MQQLVYIIELCYHGTVLNEQKRKAEIFC